jgi:hypothetical protein
MRTSICILLAIEMISAAASSVATAEDCRVLPPGPERRACAMREHPALFEKKLERCSQIANDRGFSKGGNDAKSYTNTKQDFVRSCMTGRQQ